MKLLALWTVTVIVMFQLAGCAKPREQMDWKGLTDYLDKQESDQ